MGILRNRFRDSGFSVSRRQASVWRRRRAPWARKAALEPLEQRWLLSLGDVFPMPDAPGSPGADSQPAYVMAGDGGASTVKAHQKISDTEGNFAGMLDDDDNFGTSVAHVGDLDGDGVADLAVGAHCDDDGGYNRGAVWMLFLNSDGTVKAQQKISDTQGSFTGILDDGDYFGRSVAHMGDLDGDGVSDLAVGADRDDDAGFIHGAVWMLFLNSDGTVKAHQKISNTQGNFTGPLSVYDAFGCSVANVGDLDGDGVTDLAVGATGDNDGGESRGAVWILFLNDNGTVKTHRKISDTWGNFTGTLDTYDYFGSSVANVGDLDGDGVTDLAVGATGDDDGGSDRGAVWMLFLNSNGMVKAHQKISDTEGEFTGTLDDSDHFGTSIANVGDLNGDGVSDLAVGARWDDDGGSDRGAVWMLFLNSDGTVKAHQKISHTGGSFTGILDDGDYFGRSVAHMGDLDADGVSDLAVGAYADDDGGTDRGAVWMLFLSSGDDYGDAPDGPYPTFSNSNGARHWVMEDLFMGAAVDGEIEALPGAAAHGDDTDNRDDEDGLNNPAADLVLTVGAQPMVNVIVTNTTGSTATLSGWIDYNHDGVFANASERAQASVVHGTSGQVVTLTFPAVPWGSAGTTYARFRLSTDAAAEDPTGPASDGEVEDYAVTITRPSSATVEAHQKISDTEGNFTGTLDDVDWLGFSLATVGDLDGDGVTDLAVGTCLDDDGGTDRGAVWMLFLNSDGTVKAHQKISDTEGDFTGTLDDSDLFGTSVANVGDLDGDGVTDLAVGAHWDDDAGTDRGAVWMLFLNSNGTVKAHQKISDTEGNFAGILDDLDVFGYSVANVGDLDGDGVTDLAVGAYHDDDGGSYRGAVWVLFLNADGTVKAHQKISDTEGNFTGTLDDGDWLGTSLASVGDLDGDGVTDLAVGACTDDDGGSARGAVWVLFLNSDGTVKAHQKISDTEGNFTGTLDNDDWFGISLASAGDLDGDGVTDLAVGAYHDDDGGYDRGAVWMLFLGADGTVKAQQKISDTEGSFTGTLDDHDIFGSSVANVGDLDGDGVTELAVGAFGDDDGGTNRGAVWMLFLDPGDDYGDAPDGPYATLQASNGPRHGIVSDLFMGASVDDELEAFQSATADGDDSNKTDDEDGLNNPAADLLLTIGAQPTVNVIVTNTTGTTATLSGWIDYNHDGVFANAGERALAAVPDGTSGQVVTLTFPAVPRGFTGATYARFRLSTDTAAEDPTGPACDGEVEDYAVTITRPSSGTVKAHQKISDTEGNFAGTLDDIDNFGTSLANVGDLDGDGVTDLAVGAWSDDDGGTDRGAVWMLFLNSDGTVKAHQKISDTEGNFTGTLDDHDIFGSSVANVGDLDGDGVTELAVGAFGDDDGGYNRGAVWMLFLNSDGTVKAHQKISDTEGNFAGTLDDIDYFGTSVANVGDLDGDGVTDLAVGAHWDDDGGSYRGAVWVLFLNSDGTVKAHQKISDTEGNFAGTLDDSDCFGTSVANVGDLNADGVTDLAVGADGDDDGGYARGAVWVLFLNSDGTVKAHQKISDTEGNFAGTLDDSDDFGTSVASLGDLDGDGVTDLAVGAVLDDDGGIGGPGPGAVWMLFLNADGTVKAHQKISNTEGDFAGTLDDWDLFGTSVANVGDLDGDGVTDLAVGASLDDDGGTNRGAVWMLFLAPKEDYGDAPDGPYATLRASNGPRHWVVDNLFMGAAVDGELEALPTGAANGDDTQSMDDEDGLNNPAADLALTVGAQPTVNVTVTNNTGSAATLYGWIDYNGDGVFANAVERAQASVADGTSGGIVTLAFPAVPWGSAGTTYARFRLSTDAPAADPTGPASDGEVEDYAVTITRPSSGTVNVHQKISDTEGDFAGILDDLDAFGYSVANVGDLDGDGVRDLAVGTYHDDDGGTDRGAVWMLFLNPDGTVKDYQKISATEGSFAGTLDDGDWFGTSLANVGDLDGDGVTDLAAGTRYDDDGGTNRGAVWMLFLNSDGTVKAQQKISDTEGNFTGTLEDWDIFGSSVANVGDLDGDGVTELAVGAFGDDDGGTDRGAVWMLFLNSDGTVKAHQKISDTEGNFTGTLEDWDIFGSSVANVGDLDGDGVTDLAVGAFGDDDGGANRGAVWMLFLNSDGTVRAHQKISDTEGNFTGTLDDADWFGFSLANVGDLDGDGVSDLAVGADRDDDGGANRGAVWVLFLNSDGTVKAHQKISDTEGDFTGTLDDGDLFGTSVANVGDLNGDGVTDLAVGADTDDDGGADRGAVWMLFLSPRDYGDDYGDAPDGPYATLSSSNGPRHEIVDTLFMGAAADAELEALPTVAADGDDTDATDDEDGLVDPTGDLDLLVGQTPTVDVKVTNNTGTAATLYGWIDYNGDGVFSNASERAQASVLDGTSGGIVTLTFPAVPEGFTGTTYARFRLGTDAAAADPTGPAFDGEVEDYAATITRGTVNPYQKISDTEGDFTGALDNDDWFGISVAAVGDLDGDGVTDLAAGTRYDDDGGTNRGAVWMLFLNSDGTVKAHQKISDTEGNFTGTLDDYDYFGYSLANLGDLDGDGVTDLAVGAHCDDDGGSNRGAVWMLFLNSDGTVKAHQKISDTEGNFTGTLDNSDYFGTSVANLGDLDGDGVIDLAVGAHCDDDGGTNRGAVWLLFLGAGGTVKGHKKISDVYGNFAGTLDDVDLFACSVANVGDLDGDGVTDLAVGAAGDDDGGSERGAVWMLFLNSDGTVKAQQKISDTAGYFTGTLDDSDNFGVSLANVGDLDGDGVTDLAVGAAGDDDGGADRGTVWMLFLNADGTVRAHRKISDTEGNFTGTLDDGDLFGTSLANVGDVDGDGITELAVGAAGDDDGGSDRGAVWMLPLAPKEDYGDAPDGPYATLWASDGPRHEIVDNLFMGTVPDAEPDAFPTPAADGDDNNNTDDEDGLVDPAGDLDLLVGQTPAVDIKVTNNTGSAATLYGWIDYNGDGLFDNATERASIAVPDGSTDATVTLTFPVVPSGFLGDTYARFRLSTDSTAAQNPTGAASDGEVEDYQASIHASVVGRHVFYNHSGFDGNDPAASAADDNARVRSPSEVPDTGTHDGGDNEAVLTDSTASWTNDALIGFTVTNVTDGSQGVITDNTSTTITAVLSGGSEDDWDAGDSYSLPSFLGKTALLPGGTASFLNYTNYYKGINGIMVDISGLPAETLAAGDFEFKVGLDLSDPAGWSAPPSSPSVDVRGGAGVGGSDRVSIIWANREIMNQWLQVTVKANEHTGLASEDMFYFGNAVGETLNEATQARVTTGDVLRTRARYGEIDLALTDRCDHTHDGSITTADVIAARGNYGFILPLGSPPAPSAGLGEVPVGVGRGVGKGKPLDLYYSAPRTPPADPYPAGIDQTRSSGYSPVWQAIERQESRRVDFLLADALWLYEADAASADEDAEEPLDANAVDEVFALSYAE